MKIYRTFVGDIAVLATQLSPIEVYDRPIESDDDEADKPLKEVMPARWFRESSQISAQREKLLNRILMALLETLALQLIDYGNVFIFPGKGHSFRVGICNVGKTQRSFRPIFAYSPKQQSAKRIVAKRFYSGYEWTLVFGKALHKRLKQKWMAGYNYRKKKDL